MRWRLVISGLLLLTSVTGGLAWLCFTESGLNWAYRQSLAYLPGKLKVSEVSGKLVGPVKLSDLRYQQVRQIVDLRQATLDWNPWTLLKGELEIREIDVVGLQIQLPQTDTNAVESPAPTVFPKIALPVAINLQRLEIADIRIIQGDETVVLEQLQLSLSGKVKSSPQLPHEIELSWQSQLGSGASLQGRAKLVGDLSRSRLIHSVAGAMQLDLDLTLDKLLTQPLWRGELVLQKFDPILFSPTMPAVVGSLRLTAEGDLNSAAANGHLEIEQSPYGPLSTSFDVQRIALTDTNNGITFNTLRLNTLDGEIKTSGRVEWQPEMAWQTSISATAINPEQFLPEWPGHIDASIDLSGSMLTDSLALTLDIERFQGELRNYPVTLLGKLDWNDSLADIEGFEITSGKTRLTVDGRVTQQVNLEWSLASENLAELYPSAQGRLNAQGRIQGMRNLPVIDALLKGNDIDILDIKAEYINADLNLSLDLQQLDQFPTKGLNLELDGRQIQWREFNLSEVKLKADERNLQAIIEMPQGSADIELKGNLQADGWRGSLLRAHLQNSDYGVWRLIEPVALAISPDRYSIETACLQNARNGKACVALEQVDKAGKIDLDLHSIPLQLLRPWLPPEINIDSLADAAARLQYRLPQQVHGQVDIKLLPGSIGYELASKPLQRIEFESAVMLGTLTESGIESTFKFKQADGNGINGVISLPSANLATLDPATQALKGKLRLRLPDLGLIDASLHQVEKLQGILEAEFDIVGSIAEPRMSGQAQLKDGSLFLPLSGLEINGLNVDAFSTSTGQIEYRGRAKIAEGDIALEGHTRLDASAGWPSVIKINGEQLGLQTLLQAYLPENLVVDGRVSALAELSIQLPAQLRAKVELRSQQGLLSYPVADNENGQWAYRDIRLDLKIDEHGVTAEGNLDIGENSLKAKLRLPDARALAFDPETQVLKARLDLSVQDLSLLESLLPDLRQPNGQLQLNLEIAGTVAQPQIMGKADLEMISLGVPRLGLNLKHIKLQAGSDQAGMLSINGSAGSGEGNLELQGSGRLTADPGWQATVKITGKDFEAARIPEAIVSLSPELEISLAHKSIDVQGEVLIPYARLRPRDVTLAARVSNDAVIVGQQQTAEYGWRIDSNVRLLLGERVDIFGYGFDGLLGGNLVIEESPGQPTRGTGEITIVEGRYRAYGQHLDVEQGRLLFTGGPLNNPGLDVRAVRKTQGVTAGVKISGRLQQPRIDLFSMPSLGQTDTLSYLLTGGPLDSASSGQGAMMANAALALGLTGGDQIARSIGDRFGFDEMRVESSSSGDQASLVVGRYLSPRLYVGYGVGLIESINTFNLRYQISDRWQLEAESGSRQGADLFYRFER